MPIAVEGNVRVGFRRAQTTIKVQVPLEERTGATTVDVQVQSEGDVIFGKCLSDLCINTSWSPLPPAISDECKSLRSVDSPNVHSNAEPVENVVYKLND